MDNYSLPKNSRIIKIATTKKNKKINELLQIRDQMINNNIDPTIIKNYVDEQYKEINVNYEKSINKKTNSKKVMDKRRDEAIKFLLKNKNFLEQNNAKPEYITEYVRKQYEDINKTYVLDDGINFID
jgi:tRNA/tmRNA/rRNA uracil-C5-methylase (TrmA/RlmC/RlmD family)